MKKVQKLAILFYAIRGQDYASMIVEVTYYGVLISPSDWVFSVYENPLSSILRIYAHLCWDIILVKRVRMSE